MTKLDIIKIKVDKFDETIDSLDTSKQTSLEKKARNY